MIHIIFGAPGAGKTSLNAYFLKSTYRSEGRRLLDYTRNRISEINADRRTPLTLPAKPPIFSDFKVRFLDGYDTYYEPYYLNGFYFGLANDMMATQFIPPGSRIFLSEGQKYFDSRQNTTFPRWVSSAFEMHRHYGIDIWIDVQRPKLIDLNIRALCKHFIEVRGMVNDESATGCITKNTWLCREFDCSLSVEQYLETGEGEYRENSYVHEGNIFDVFDSAGHFKDFLPSDGKDFTYLPFLGDSAPPKEYEAFYSLSEPKEYRTKPTVKKKDETK